MTAHLTSKRGNSHRINWIRSLKDSGKRPDIEVIDEVPVEYWPQWEVAWIAYLKELGCRLTNSNAGGEGSHDPSPEARRKLSEANIGKTRPPEIRQKISMGLTGRPCSDKCRKIVGDRWRGKTMPEEICKKMSENNKGSTRRPRSPEHCAKITANKLAYWAKKKLDFSIQNCMVSV